MMRRTLSSLLGVLVIAAVAGCARATPSPDLSGALAATDTAAPGPAHSPTARATSTLTPLPTSTPTPSPTATSTPVPNPTLTPTPLHPLMIESLRAGAYPGSDIVIEENLSPGSNYDRYIASYRSEGLKIYALLTVPQAEAPDSGWPVIVFNHGYIPPDQYRTTERYVAYVDGFARNGYIVFRPDYRGHDRSEGEPVGAYFSPAYTIDVLNAVGSMKRYSAADPDRIGMWGHSMGGHITLQVMVTTTDVKAGVIWAGLMGSAEDLVKRWYWRRWGCVEGAPCPALDSDDERSRPIRQLQETYGSFEENPEFWSAVSSTAYLADVSGPLQLHHGTGDASVDPEFSESLYEIMVALDKPVELYLYEGDNHNLSNSFGTAMTRSIEFFDRYLKP